MEQTSDNILFVKVIQQDNIFSNYICQYHPQEKCVKQLVYYPIQGKITQIQTFNKNKHIVVTKIITQKNINLFQKIQKNKVIYESVVHQLRSPFKFSSYKTSYKHQMWFMSLSQCIIYEKQKCQLYQLKDNQLQIVDCKYKFSNTILALKVYEKYVCILYRNQQQTYIELIQYVENDFKILYKLQIKVLDFTISTTMYFNCIFNPCAVIIQNINVIVVNFIRGEVFVTVLPESDNEKHDNIILQRIINNSDEDTKYLIDAYKNMQNVNVQFICGAVVISKQLLDLDKYYTITIPVNMTQKTQIIFTHINNLYSYDQYEVQDLVQLSQILNKNQQEKNSIGQEILSLRQYIINYYSKKDIQLYKPLQQYDIISPYNFLPQSFIQLLSQSDFQKNNSELKEFNDINDEDIDYLQNVLQKFSVRIDNNQLQNSEDSQINPGLIDNIQNSFLADASQSMMYYEQKNTFQPNKIRSSPQRQIFNLQDPFSTSISYADIDRQELAFKYLRPLEENKASDDIITKIRKMFKLIPFSKLIDYSDFSQRFYQLYYNNELYIFDFMKQSILQTQFTASPDCIDNSTNILQFYIQCPYIYSQMIQYQQIKHQIYFECLLQSNFLSNTLMCQSVHTETFTKQLQFLCQYQDSNIILISYLIASKSIINIYQAFTSYNFKYLKYLCQQITNIIILANSAQPSSINMTQCREPVAQIVITRINGSYNENSVENSIYASSYQTQYLPQTDGILFDLDQMLNIPEVEQQKQSIQYKCQKLKADFKSKCYDPYQDNKYSNIKRYKYKTAQQIQIYDSKLQYKMDTAFYDAFYKVITNWCQVTNQQINNQLIKIFYSIVTTTLSNTVELSSFTLKQFYQQKIANEANQLIFYKNLIYLTEFAENLQLTVGNSLRSLIDVVVRKINVQRLYEQLYSQSVL